MKRLVLASITALALCIPAMAGTAAPVPEVSVIGLLGLGLGGLILAARKNRNNQ